jgi:hypothetical protein
MERTTRDMRETVAQSRGVIIESRELMALMDAQQRVAERRTALRTKERPRKRD